MTITLIDEARYDAEMDATVLPALQACMTEGWMEPATVDWEGKALPKLERPGRLHYYRYDARTFDALREEGASGVFRGAIVISHGFTEFGRKYSEMVWYFLLAGYSVCVFEHRGHGHSTHDMSNPSLVWPISPHSRRPWDVRRPVMARCTCTAIPWAAASARLCWNATRRCSTRRSCPRR